MTRQESINRMGITRGTSTFPNGDEGSTVDNKTDVLERGRNRK